MVKSIRIVILNANGLLPHQEEVQVLLKLNKFDLCLILETHFTKKSYLKFKRYKVHHAIQPQNVGRGGSAIIIENNFLHDKEAKIETDQMQLIIIKIKTKT